MRGQESAPEIAVPPRANRGSETSRLASQARELGMGTIHATEPARSLSKSLLGCSRRPDPWKRCQGLPLVTAVARSGYSA